MTSTAGAIAWAVICLTYLRFKKAAQKQNLENLMVKEAESPLQPYLAIYGLVFSLFLSTISLLICLTQ